MKEEKEPDPSFCTVGEVTRERRDESELQIEFMRERHALRPIKRYGTICVNQISDGILGRWIHIETRNRCMEQRRNGVGQ